MALEIPDSAEQIANETKTDVQRELGGSNPFAKNNWLGAIISGISNRIFDFYIQLKLAIDFNIPDTATGTYLDRWKTIFRITTLQATKASGNVMATGTVTTNIPATTVVVNASGGTYTSTALAIISAFLEDINSITRSGQTATATFLNNHNMASGLEVTVAGANETEYNGAFTITVTGDKTFTYEVTGSPSTPATGTTTGAATFASVPVEADTAGETFNLTTGEAVTLQSPITNVDATMTTDFGEVAGGSDTETDADARTRMVERIQQPVAHFNEGDISTLARSLNGVTRVFVHTPSTATTATIITASQKDGAFASMTIGAGHPYESGQVITITNVPEGAYNLTDVVCLKISATELGYVVGAGAASPTGNVGNIVGPDVTLGTTKVYFMRDNDDDPIPSASEILTLKTLLDTILPANMSTTDLSVLAPTANEVDFAFSALEPNTDSMQTAIEASLSQIMIDRTSVGLGMTQEIYEAAITNTFDTVEEQFVESYTVVMSDDIGSTGDVDGSTGYIPVLGETTYP